MYDQSNVSTEFRNSDQDKFVGLIKLIQEFDAIKGAVPVDLYKLKTIQDELSKKLEDIEDTVPKSIRDDPKNREIIKNTRTTLARIKERIINNSVFEGLGLDPAVEKLGQATDAAPDTTSKSITAGSAIILAYFDRFVKLANRIKTPLGSNRGGRGGGASSGKYFENRAEEGTRRWLDGSASRSEQSPRNYLPPDMQKGLDEHLAAIKAKEVNAGVKESSGYTQAALRDKLLKRREDREDMERAKQNLASDQERAEAFRWVDFADADADDGLHKWERASNLAEAVHAANKAARESPGYTQAAIRDKLLSNRELREHREYMDPGNADGDPFSRQHHLDVEEQNRENASSKSEKPAYTRPIGTEVIDPVEYLRNARENPLSYTPVTFREPARYIPTAAWAAMAAQSAAGPAAGSSNVTVTIKRILPPPTHLADEDFRRCMQREIDQIVETFDTGVRE